MGMGCNFQFFTFIRSARRNTPILRETIDAQVLSSRRPTGASVSQTVSAADTPRHNSATHVQHAHPASQSYSAHRGKGKQNFAHEFSRRFRLASSVTDCKIDFAAAGNAIAFKS